MTTETPAPGTRDQASTGARGRTAANAAAAGKPRPTRARVHTRATRHVRAAATRHLTRLPGVGWAREHRTALTPPAVALLVWVTAGTAHTLTIWWALPTAVVLALTAVWVFTQMMSEAFTAPTAVTWWTALAYVLAGLTVAPWGRPMLALGAVLALPLVGFWWWRLTRRPPAPVGVPEQVATWSARLGHEKGALPGSWVVKAAALPGAEGKPSPGFRMIVQLPPGALSYGQVVKATHAIASAYGVPSLGVTVEHTPSRDASAAMVTIMEKSPLHAVQPWPGPSLDKKRGTFKVGVYEDGKPALWRLWRPGSGAVHGLIAGTTGSGKSGTSNVLLAEAALSGMVCTFLVDPKAGQSLPEWVQALPPERVATTEAKWLALLEGLVRVMDARAAHLAKVEWVDSKGRKRRGMAHFDPMDPAHGMPLLLGFVDEAFTVLAPNSPAIRFLELLGTKGRSVGIVLVFATQRPSVKDLGESGTLRAMVSSGQILILRTSDKVSAGMALMGNLPVDPTEISADHPGMGFLSGRSAAMRGLWVDDPWKVAQSAPLVPLDPITAAALEAPARDEAKPYGTPAVADTLRGAPRAVVERLAWMGPQTRLQLVEALTPAYSDRGIRDAIKRLVTAGTLTESPDRKTITLPEVGERPPPV